MDIRNTKQLKAFAAQRLGNVPQEKKIVLLYAAGILGLSVAATLVNYLLSQQISQTGGLGNMSTRAVLSTLQTMLPIGQIVVTMCLELGYMAAMLRIARGQFVSTRTLKLGFDRFWPLMRLTLLRAALLLAVGFGCMYAGVSLYVMTPLSDGAVSLMQPMLQGGVLDPSAMADPLFYSQLMKSMIPCFLICGLLYLVIGVPMWYRYRMAEYVLIDKPGQGAWMALRESRQILYRNRLRLFRLDLALWLFYLLSIAASVVAYGDMVLPLLGVALPWSDTFSYYLFFGLYLVVQLGIYYFLGNRVGVTYALAYDSLRPQETADNTVVLGNIFQVGQ